MDSLSPIKLSIVIPSFNDIRIIDTINSIKGQSVPKNMIEIVIMDPGSRIEILEEIKLLLDENDKLIIDQDEGIFDGINKGIQNSSGEIIFTLGSDDKLAYPEAAEEIIQMFNNNKLDFVCSDLIYTNDNWEPVRFWEATLPSFFSFLLGKQVGHFSFASRRKVYDCIGVFNKDLYVSADFDFFIRLGKSTLRGQRLNKVVTFMKLGGNSSRNIINILKGNMQMLFVALRHYGPFAIFHFLFKPFWKLKEYNAAKNILS